MARRGFNAEETKLIDLLVESGIKKNIAKTLVYLRKKKETTSVQLEGDTALRQPEVSIAMQDLRKRKWVTKRDIKKEGKGRPVHSYRLAIPFSKVIDRVIEERKKEIAKIEKSIKRLEEFKKD